MNDCLIVELKRPIFSRTLDSAWVDWTRGGGMSAEGGREDVGKERDNVRVGRGGMRVYR